MSSLPFLIKTNTGTWLDSRDIRSLTTSNGFYRVFVHALPGSSYYPVSQATFENIIARLELIDATDTSLAKVQEDCVVCEDSHAVIKKPA